MSSLTSSDSSIPSSTPTDAAGGPVDDQIRQRIAAIRRRQFVPPDGTTTPPDHNQNVNVPPSAVPPPPPVTMPPPGAPPGQQPPTSTGRPIKDKPPRGGFGGPPRGGPPGGGGFGDFDRRFPERDFMRFPDRFFHFDHRFDDDRRRFNVFRFRREFFDDDVIRFVPIVRAFPNIDIGLVLHILGFAYNPGYSRFGRVQPSGSGIWEIGVDGLWYRVTQPEESIIERVETARGGGGIPPVII